jgi:predicted O-methyltransferase YrrM
MGIERITSKPVPDEPASDRLLLTMPILKRMQAVQGWLEDEEADLLIAVAVRALASGGERPAIVEVGSYCGRSTLVLGSVVREVCPRAKVYAIDPHEGRIADAGPSPPVTQSTFPTFSRNIADAGLETVVEAIVKRSHEVAWESPIRLLFIDGFHDYRNVARDFHHFERWVEPGAYVAFHDYSLPLHPGVVTFVNETLTAGRYRAVCRAGSLLVARKTFQRAHVKPGTEWRETVSLRETRPVNVDEIPVEYAQARSDLHLSTDANPLRAIR